MKYTILFILILFRIQYSNGQEYIKIQENLTKSYYANSEAKVGTEKELPIFKFNKKEIGDFIINLCDTITKIHQYEIITIESIQDYKTDIDTCDMCKNDYIYIHSDDLDDKIENNVKGIVILSKDEIAFLMNDNPEWLSKIGLYKTNKSFILKFGDYIKYRLAVLREKEYSALVKIIDNRKVEPIWITKITTDINLTSDGKHFDWIQNFYEN